MIEVEQLSYEYPGSEPLHFPAFSCRRQEQLLITGPSGSGKTTLLHLLAGLRLPHSGEVRIRQQSLSALSPARRDRFRGQHIGLVFQQMHFVQSLDVLENIMLQQYLAGLPQDSRRASHLLDRLNLLPKKRRQIRQLSLGEQQRVAIARALVNSPAVLLADEPTSSLDDANSLRVTGLLEEMASTEHAALLVVTHDRRLKELIPNQIAL
jgi:ABC-type lipoprotein export system ATPase subunit